MKVTVVGCSGSYPGPTSAASSYLVEADGFRLVLDLGNGALGALQRHAPLDSIGAVALSHLHVDHCIDLTSYYVVRRYHPAGHMPLLPVYGPRGTAKRLAHAYGLPRHPGMTEEFDFRAYPEEPFQIGPLSVRAVPVAHPVEAYALRVEHDGAVVVYSGDTGPTPTLSDLAMGADVFLCEASFTEHEDNPPDLHLSGAQAGALAEQAGVGHLVLTHIPPWGDSAAIDAEAAATFAGRRSLAEPGMVLEC